MSFFYELNPILQSFIAAMITFLITALGSACIFLTKNISKKYMDIQSDTSCHNLDHYK